jgi:hypothetical protein
MMEMEREPSGGLRRLMLNGFHELEYTATCANPMDGDSLADARSGRQNGRSHDRVVGLQVIGFCLEPWTAPGISNAH